MEQADAKQAYDITKIFEVVLAFNSVTGRTELLTVILTKMMELTDSDAGTLYTIDDGKLHFRIVRNKTLGIFISSEDEINLPPIVLDENNIQNVSAYSAINNEIVQIDDVYGENERFNLSGPKNYDKLTGYRTRAMLVLPLCTQGSSGGDDDVLGVIQMMNPITKAGVPGIYGNIYYPPVLPAMARIAANTLSNLTYVKELRLLLRAFAAVMTQAIDERSPYNNNHTQNVARYCERFAIHLGNIFPIGHPFHFDTQHVERLVLAALLHDIGKVITPLTIMDKPDRLGNRLESVRYRFALKKHQTEIDWLHKRLSDEQYAAQTKAVSDALDFIEHVNKVAFLQDEQLEKVLTLRGITYINAEGTVAPILDPDDIDALSIRKGTLTDSERKIMQQHVTITGRLLDKIPFWKYYGNVPHWARSHHEFLDGTGYPQGLTGDDIPIEACIITIMDIFDALRDNDRPYKKAMPLDKSLKVLAEMAEEGKLHKELVRLFAESKLWEEIE